MKNKQTDPKKLVRQMGEWAKVARELEGENLKEKIYDNTLFQICGGLEGKRVLDYGAGPAVVASRAKKSGAEVKVFDISEQMRKISERKLGSINVYQKTDEIPDNYFDVIFCNLVLCIVPENEVEAILRNIRNALNGHGIAYVGFCNPLIFDLLESVIDYRLQTGKKYEENHTYQKIKKEGDYKIDELHRPIEWYREIFEKVGIKLEATFFTPSYNSDGRQVSDFVIFKLVKEEVII